MGPPRKDTVHMGGSHAVLRNPQTLGRPGQSETLVKTRPDGTQVRVSSAEKARLRRDTTPEDPNEARRSTSESERLKKLRQEIADIKSRGRESAQNTPQKTPKRTPPKTAFTPRPDDLVANTSPPSSSDDEHVAVGARNDSAPAVSHDHPTSPTTPHRTRVDAEEAGLWDSDSEVDNETDVGGMQQDLQDDEPRGPSADLIESAPRAHTKGTATYAEVLARGSELSKPVKPEQGTEDTVGVADAPRTRKKSDESDKTAPSVMSLGISKANSDSSPEKEFAELARTPKPKPVEAKKSSPDHIMTKAVLLEGSVKSCQQPDTPEKASTAVVEANASKSSSPQADKSSPKSVRIDDSIDEPGSEWNSEPIPRGTWATPDEVPVNPEKSSLWHKSSGIFPDSRPVKIDPDLVLAGSEKNIVDGVFVIPKRYADDFSEASDTDEEGAAAAAADSAAEHEFMSLAWQVKHLNIDPSVLDEDEPDLGWGLDGPPTDFPMRRRKTPPVFHSRKREHTVMEKKKPRVPYLENYKTVMKPYGTPPQKEPLITRRPSLSLNIPVENLLKGPYPYDEAPTPPMTPKVGHSRLTDDLERILTTQGKEAAYLAHVIRQSHKSKDQDEYLRVRGLKTLQSPNGTDKLRHDIVDEFGNACTQPELIFNPRWFLFWGIFTDPESLLLHLGYKDTEELRETMPKPEYFRARVDGWELDGYRTVVPTTSNAAVDTSTKWGSDSAADKDDGLKSKGLRGMAWRCESMQDVMKMELFEGEAYRLVEVEIYFEDSGKREIGSMFVAEFPTSDEDKEAQAQVDQVRADHLEWTKKQRKDWSHDWYWDWVEAPKLRKLHRERIEQAGLESEVCRCGRHW